MKRVSIYLKGDTGTLADRIITNWMLTIRDTNPAILEMFRDRDLPPYRDLLPWSGEFAGKHLVSAHALYRLTGHQALYESAIAFLDELIGLQGEDGYLGCYREACRLTGAFSQDPSATGQTWDAWSHYHILYGLYLWYRETLDGRYWQAILRAADLFMRLFYNGKRLVSIGNSEMNLAPLHIFAILYRETGDRKFLDFAMEIVQDLAHEEAGNYINHSIRGLEYYQCPKPRWESLHIVMGIAELYACTGEVKYLDVARHIFFSILKTDVHNTGAFSTDEQAIGHPFRNAAIETCCVIAYNALACQLLALTPEVRIADFLELSLYNAVMGAFSPSGRWSTYSTPMDGEKCANYHSIVFQSRPGSPDLNCCSVHAPRGIGMLGEWMLLEHEDVVMINFFENLEAEFASGLRIVVSGDYPVRNHVTIRIHSPGSQKIAIRMPHWSPRTKAALNGTDLATSPGTWLVLDRSWNGDAMDIEFDFAARFLDGDQAYKGMKSLYIGPILYGFDVSENPSFNMDALPGIPLSDVETASPRRKPDGRILLPLDCGITLKDFCHLGQSGCRYRTWLRFDG